MKRWTALVIGSALVVAGCAPGGGSGRYPDGDVRLVVPGEAGEHTDTVARAFAPCLADRLGTGVTVENRPGEEGMRGTREFAEADTDAHTLLVAAVGPAVVAPAVAPDAGYGFEDFGFVGLLHSSPMVLFTGGTGPFDTAEALFGAARAAPVEIATTGAWLTEELTVAELNALEGTRFETGRADSDDDVLRGVLAGDHPAGLAAMSADLLARTRSGEIRVLAVSGELAPDYLREAPTFDRVAGAVSLPKFTNDTMLIAQGIPADGVIRALMDAVTDCLNTETVRQDLGEDFVPDELITHGELRSLFHRLENAARTAERR